MTLALYIDKWYIVGTVCVDGMSRVVSLPNHEDRIWLYFFEDISDDIVSYGKGYEMKCLAKEKHYYGDVFSLLTSSAATYTEFKRKQPIEKIFASAGIFDDLRNNVESGDCQIETFVSFSQDISYAARYLFLKELEANHFHVRESAARIGHLALEHAARKNGFEDEGFYLVLEASNENLHYSLYRKTEGIFVLSAEEKLSGMGMDVRRRALVEYVVDHINDSELFFKSHQEREAEYLKMDRFVDDWLGKLSSAKSRVPVVLSDIKFPHDPYKQYSLSVPKAKIDERTERIVADIVRVVVEFANGEGVKHEQICGILMLGNTFTNSQFKKELGKTYNLPDSKELCFRDTDLATLVGVYNFIDLQQFSAESKVLKKNGEEDLRRILQNEREAEAMRTAREEAEEKNRIRLEIEQKEREFQSNMDKARSAELEHDYGYMVECIRLALEKRPDDDEAKQYLESAKRKQIEWEIHYKEYSQRIQLAQKAFDSHDYETSRQKAEEALGFMPDSKEAQRIKEESNRYMHNVKDFEDHLVHADSFVSIGAYEKAQDELAQARSLGLKIHEEKLAELDSAISKGLRAIKERIASLTTSLETAISELHYDDAISICNELVREDSSKAQKWKTKMADVLLLQALINEMRGAEQYEDWAHLANLCEKFLILSSSGEISSKLAFAREKQRLSTVQQVFDQAYENKNWKEIIELANGNDSLKKNRENNKIINTARRMIANGRFRNSIGQIDTESSCRLKEQGDNITRNSEVTTENKNPRIKKPTRKNLHSPKNMVTSSMEGKNEDNHTKRKFPKVKHKN